MINCCWLFSILFRILARKKNELHTNVSSSSGSNGNVTCSWCIQKSYETASQHNNYCSLCPATHSFSKEPGNYVYNEIETHQYESDGPENMEMNLIVSISQHVIQNSNIFG